MKKLTNITNSHVSTIHYITNTEYMQGTFGSNPKNTPKTGDPYSHTVKFCQLLFML